jgi:hypothetical protein
MVRRTDRPRLKVRVSFETTRFSQQHLIEVYARLAPTSRRSLRLTREDVPPSKTPKTAMGSGVGHDRRTDRNLRACFQRSSGA